MLSGGHKSKDLQRDFILRALRSTAPKSSGPPHAEARRRTASLGRQRNLSRRRGPVAKMFDLAIQNDTRYIIAHASPRGAEQRELGVDSSQPMAEDRYHYSALWDRRLQVTIWPKSLFRSIKEWISAVQQWSLSPVPEHWPRSFPQEVLQDGLEVSVLGRCEPSGNFHGWE